MRAKPKQAGKEEGTIFFRGGKARFKVYLWRQILLIIICF